MMAGFTFRVTRQLNHLIQIGLIHINSSTLFFFPQKPNVLIHVITTCIISLCYLFFGSISFAIYSLNEKINAMHVYHTLNLCYCVRKRVEPYDLGYGVLNENLW